ncbi:MAG: hypothetical protein Q8L86_02700 [Vicinamibacterales bacterium]|nr:hypothetical protein [Vicinamibacterales bacterium]
MTLVLTLSGLFSALGLALVLNLTLERLLLANAREASSLLTAAESALEAGLHDLGAQPTWETALAGARVSAFSDGVAAGTRTMAAGETIDLGESTAQAMCGRSSCGEPHIVAVTAARPWGAANPRWRLFAWGRASALAGAGWPADPYLLVWVADDPMDEDGDPARDAPAGAAGHGVVLLRAEARGRRGARAVIEVVARDRCATAAPGPCVPGIRVQSWRVVE